MYDIVGILVIFVFNNSHILYHFQYEILMILYYNISIILMDVIDLLQILRHVNTSKIISHSIYSYKTEYKIVTTVIDALLELLI